MRNYTTQMDAARKGILTPEIKTVAQKEHMSTDEMMKLVAEGKVAICANKNHTCLNPEGVGSMLRTKINVNAESDECCKSRSRGHYGFIQPRQHSAFPAEADTRMSGNDRNCSGL